MSTRMPSVAVLQQKKIVDLTEAWNRCKADNARLEREREDAIIKWQAERLALETAWGHLESQYLDLLRRAIERSVIAPELRAEIVAALDGEKVKA